MKKTTITIIGFLLILIAGVIIFFMQDIINYFNKPIVETIDKTSVYEGFQELPNSNQLSREDFNKGFWCEKDGDLKFFSLKGFKDNGYSEADIKNILKDWGDCSLVKKDNIKFIADKDLPEDEKFNNELYSSSYLLDNKYLDNKKALENKNPKTAMDYYKLSMIYSLEGNYKKSNKYSSLACKKDKKFCQKNSVKITGKVKDSNGNGISGVKVSLTSQDLTSLTNNKGEYILNVKINKLKKERLSFEKAGYSTTFLSVLNISDLQKEIKNQNAEMVKSDKIYTINLRKKTIDSDGKIDGNKVILKSNISTYEIPLNGFVTDNGRKYEGVVKAYLYEFNDETVPQSLISLDSFSGSGSNNNFTGTSMKTFGMPYIIFKDEKGNRLDIKKSNPMVLTTFIGGLKEIMNSPKLADDKKEEILENSKKGEFYYTLEKIDKNYLPLIPYWVLDQKTGVWENTGFDVIDKEGHLRTQFYTTK